MNDNHILIDKNNTNMEIEDTKHTNEIVDEKDIKNNTKSNFNANTNTNSENKENFSNMSNTTNNNENSIRNIFNDNINKYKLNVEIVNPKNISSIKILDDNDNKMTNNNEEEISGCKRVGIFEDSKDSKKQKTKEGSQSDENGNNFNILFNSSLRDPNNPISYTITGPDFKKNGLELVIEDHRNSSLIENMRQRIPEYEQLDSEIQEKFGSIYKELDQYLHNILNDIDISILKKGKDHEENNVIKAFLNSKLDIIEKTINYYRQLKHSLENDLFSIQAVKNRLMKDYVNRFGRVDKDDRFHDILKESVICKISINRNKENNSDSIEKLNESNITYHSRYTTSDKSDRKSDDSNTKNTIKYKFSKNKGKEKDNTYLDSHGRPEGSLNEDINVSNFDVDLNHHRNKKGFKIMIDVENTVDDSKAFQKYIRHNLDYLIKNYQTRINNVNLKARTHLNPNKLSLDELPLFSSSISLKLTEEFFKNLFPKFEDILPRFQDIVPGFENIFASLQNIHSPLFMLPHPMGNRDDPFDKSTFKTFSENVPTIRNERRNDAFASTSGFSRVKTEDDTNGLNNTSSAFRSEKEHESIGHFSRRIKEEEEYNYKSHKKTPIKIKKERERIPTKSQAVKKEGIDGEDSTGKILNPRSKFADIASSSRSIHRNDLEPLIRPPLNNNFEIPINSMFSFENTIESEEEELKSSSSSSIKKYKKHGKHEELYSNDHNNGESSHEGKKNKKKKKKGKRKEEEDCELIVID